MVWYFKVCLNSWVKKTHVMTNNVQQLKLFLFINTEFNRILMTQKAFI